eukprot:Gb_14849 [translate_table: standard]
MWPGILTVDGTLLTTGYELSAGQTRRLDGRAGCGGAPFAPSTPADKAHAPRATAAARWSATATPAKPGRRLQSPHNRDCQGRQRHLQHRRRPRKLQVDGCGRGRVVACKNACVTFGSQYCSKPSSYSQLFKTACPNSYSYSFDDASSMFTCTGADFIITLCQTIAGLKIPKESPGAVIGNNTVWGVNTTAIDNQAVSSLTATLFVRVSIAIVISLTRMASTIRAIILKGMHWAPPIAFIMKIHG